MAEGQQESFGHYLLCLFGLATKAMNDPRLKPFLVLPNAHSLSTMGSSLLFPFFPQCQQFIKGFDTMNHQRLLHFFRQCHMCTKGLYL
jgi:hypothetical protein